MNVSEPKALLANLPDDMQVVVSGDDHSYFLVGGAGVVKAEKQSRGSHLWQYYDDANKSGKDNPVIDVFWIDDGRY